MDLMQKYIKDSILCDKIITCRNKIRCIGEKVLSLLSKSTNHNMGRVIILISFYIP